MNEAFAFINRQQYRELPRMNAAVRYVPRNEAVKGAEDRRGVVTGTNLERDLMRVKWQSGIENLVPIDWLEPA